MVDLAGCETGWDPFSINPMGPYIGLYQLGPGMQREFWQWEVRQGLPGHDLHDPSRQANFVAEVIAAGRQSNWPPYGRRCK